MLETYTAALAKSNVARPHRAAQKAYWDIAGGTVTGHENQSFLLSLGGQHQHDPCPICEDEMGALDIADNFVVPELFLEQWLRSNDQGLVDTSSTLISTPVSQTPPELADALDDLSEVIEEAEEKGYQAPTETAINAAKRLLETMYVIAPQRFEVYPMPGGEVTIDAKNQAGQYLMLLIANDGSARSLTNSASGRSRRNFASTDDIPSEFLRETLLETDVSNG